MGSILAVQRIKQLHAAKQLPIILYTHAHARTHAHTHTHTHTLLLVLPLPELAMYAAPIQGASQQEATRQVALLAAGTPTSSHQLHGLLSAVGVLIYGLARPTDERGGVHP